MVRDDSTTSVDNALNTTSAAADARRMALLSARRLQQVPATLKASVYLGQQHADAVDKFHVGVAVLYTARLAAPLHGAPGSYAAVVRRAYIRSSIFSAEIFQTDH